MSLSESILTDAEMEAALETSGLLSDVELEATAPAKGLLQPPPASVSPATSLHSIPEVVNETGPEPASAPIKIRATTMSLNFASPQIGTKAELPWMLCNTDKKRTAQIQFILRHCPIAPFRLEVEGEEAPIHLTGDTIQLGPGHTVSCRLFFFPKLAEEVDGKLYLSVRDLNASQTAQRLCIKIQAHPKRAPAKAQAKPLQESNAKANIPPATAASPIRVKEAMGSAGLHLWQDMVCIGVVPVGSSKKVHVPLGNLSDSPLPVELSLDKPRSDLCLGSAELLPKNSKVIPITFTPTTPGPIHMNLLINAPNKSSEKSIGVVKLSGFAADS